MNKVKSSPKTYSIKMLFNGLVFNEQTDDLSDTIKKLQPEQLHTDMYVEISKGDITTERHLNLNQGRNLFRNDDFLNVFVNNLMLN